ncbi:MAG TPA: glycoside hydrolase family 3 N-terminal domain-containing protein [Polyangiaceae bacterium]|nr:glycoside hydrolase family 3 N-terminal domain-containing protein [Polyangiaceae bacterium]
MLGLGTGVVVTTSCSHLQTAEGPGASNSSSSGSGGNQSSTSGSSTPGDTVVSGDAGVSDAAPMACTNTTYSDPYTPGYTPGSEVQSAQSLVNTLSSSTANLQTLMAGIVPVCSSPNYNTFVTPGLKSQGVNGYGFRDGPRGVNMTGAPSPVKCSNYSTCGGNYSTTFPSGSARGATFDVALEQQVGQAMGDEMVATQNNVLLAPVINVLRHPAWGRSQETYGEDSYLLGRMGSAFVSGVQQYVAACAKHFAAYNIEDGRTGPSPNVAYMDEQTFYEVYGRHFEMLVKDGGVACVMAAYNNLQIGEYSDAGPTGGTVYPCTTDPVLLTQALRTTFGFQGFVISDWWALPNTENCGTMPNQEQPIAQNAVTAGLDIEMPWQLNYSQLTDLVQNGTVPAATLGTSAQHILQQGIRLSFATGSTPLHSSSTQYNSSNNSLADNSTHIALAYQAALESMVLLKNTNNTLPIPSSAKSVAVIAAPPSQVPFALQETDVTGGNVDFAHDVRTGDLGSSRTYPDPDQAVGPFAGIQAAAPSGVTVTYGTSASDAMSADFVVVVAGLTPEDEGEDYSIPEGGDRTSFSLDDKNIHAHNMNPVQDPLIQAVEALNKPMVVVLEGGSVIDGGALTSHEWLNEVPALVMAWYPGQQGGKALGDLLFANKTSGGTKTGTQANFGGKLPVTWGSQSQYYPLSAGAGATTVMPYYLGYRYFDQNNLTPVFPFGGGLSYTTFSYSNLYVPCTTVTTGAVVNVQVDVTNTGSYDGDEITFLFVSYPNSQVRRSVKELKAFHRTTIAAGTTEQITIPLRVEDLKYWNATNHDWEWENGTVKIMVGGSSASLPLTGSITVMN